MPGLHFELRGRWVIDLSSTFLLRRRNSYMAAPEPVIVRKHPGQTRARRCTRKTRSRALTRNAGEHSFYWVFRPTRTRMT